MSYIENPRGWSGRELETHLKEIDLIIVRFRNPAWIIACDLRRSWNSDPHVVNFSAMNLQMNGRLAKERALERLNEIRFELIGQPAPPTLYLEVLRSSPGAFFLGQTWEMIEYEVAWRGNPDELKKAVDVLRQSGT